MLFLRRSQRPDPHPNLHPLRPTATTATVGRRRTITPPVLRTSALAGVVGLLGIGIMVISGAFVAPADALGVGTGTASSADVGRPAVAFNLERIKSAKGVLFDVDGTLADSWRLGYDATLVVLERNSVDVTSVTEEEYHRGCRYTTPERLARHAGLVPPSSDDGDDDGDDATFREVGDRLAREFDDLYVDLVSTETAGFFDGMHSLLSDLPPTVKVGALTNACVEYARAVLRVNTNHHDGRSVKFLSVRGADNVPRAKPHGDGLLACCDDLGLKPEECVYVGDAPSDGYAAEAAGMPSIGVTWGSNSAEVMSAAPFLRLCSSVEELRELLPSHQRA